VDDVAEAIVLATQSSFCHAEVFQIVDNDLMTRGEFARLWAAAQKPPLRVTRVSLKLACFAAGGVEWLAKLLKHTPPVSPYRLRSAIAPLVFDCTKAHEQLGWQPQVHSREALRQLLKAE